MNGNGLWHFANIFTRQKEKIGGVGKRTYNRRFRQERSSMSYTNKTLEELNVLDDFLMNAIVSTPEVGEVFCKTVLSVLLQRKIGKVRVLSQRMLPPVTPDHRGIRMDVEIQEFETENEAKIPVNIYDLEPNLRRGVHLPRHNRFYQAKVDARHMKSGEKEFVRLPNLYVITITNYDPFGYDYMMYRIVNRCKEVPELSYDDGLEFVYFYTGGHKGGDESIKAMLNYFQNSHKENAVDTATEKISEIVEQVRGMPKVRNEYMTLGDIIDWEREEAAEEAEKRTAAQQLLLHVENAMQNLKSDLATACRILGVTEEDYQKAKELLAGEKQDG